MVIIPCGLFITSLYAADDWSSRDIKKFPMQPSLVYDASRSLQSFINPFEMTSFGIGKSYVRYHRDIGNTFKEKKWFDSIRSHVYEVKLELPFHQENTSLGFDCTVFFDTVYKEKPDHNSQFSQIMAIDMLATFKFKLPFYTNLGHFAWTITPKAGLINIITGSDYQTEYWHNLGLVVGAAIGIDYYFNQWLGVFVEYSAKYNRVHFLGVKSRPQHPYAYTATALTFGVKTTF